MPVDLIQDDMEFTPECEAALVEIFSRYDKDNDGALNDEEIQAFAKYTNEAELEEIRDNLDCREEDGALLKGGFLQLYSLQTNAGDEEETWKDLKKHGYDDSLQLVKEADDDEDEKESTKQ
ncbi:hypothetical protein H4R99_008522 [Coemansia sp. RSA 1722]|nr:hypothetical protein LPJ57_003526 [Coemansia sp. RSA 486]KAJ2586205.1 hypothetical protein H4R99_008522 [Coemansia sp. RSA 1722]KAJ2597391.1 hypothetical protein GGF39_003076 [Coemansia sp. RSA 1721]KAJ2634115.1 hypothetical protein GGF40_004400 [Coemansia sp. RSA 1286]